MQTSENCFQTRFAALPQEPQDQIITYTNLIGNLLLHCSLLLPQSTWKSILLVKTYLSFPCDIEDTVVEAKAADQMTSWHWELLVHHPSQGLRYRLGISE